MYLDKENVQNAGVSLDKTQDSFKITSKSLTCATVICEKFQGAVWVGFGCVPLACKTTREFNIVNPTSQPVSLSVEKCPSQKGFSIVFGSSGTTTVTVGVSETVSGYVHWNPSDNLSVRESAWLLMDKKHRLQLTLHGVAGMGTSKVVVGKSKSIKNVVKPAVHKVPKKQNILKPVMTKNTTGKSHYAEKKVEKKLAKQREEGQINVKKDREKCIDKQIQSLTQWVNGKLLQSSRKSPDCSHSDVYTALDNCRMEDKNRREFATLLLDDHNIKVMRRVNSEVIKNRLSLRVDRNVRAHVGFKEGITNMLLSYDCQWLKLALEAQFNISIPSPPPVSDHAPLKAKMKVSISTSNPWTFALKKVIQERVLNSAEVESIFLKEGVIITPAVESKLQESLRHHILSSVLSIILLLDGARMKNMCSGRLPLFRKESEIKSSKDMIVELSRNFLQHEGDVFKHLSGLGYVVEFEQNSFHEFDFQCTDLTVDLRDGVRLARLVDLLCQSNEANNLVSSLLRVPAVSRLQKLFNVGISLKYLRLNGMDLTKVEDKAIVDGNHDATMLLLWNLLFEFDLKFVVDLSDIKSEILNLGVSTREEVLELSDTSLNDKSSASFFTDLKALLLKWCEDIALFHQKNLSSLTDGLLEGHLLCLLVHHYHPDVLPLDQIQDSSESVVDNEEKKTIIFSLESLSSRNKHAVTRHNLLVLARALKVLGGVPLLLSTDGSTDERSIVMFLGFLFARLVHTTKQASAASLIQRKIRTVKYSSTMGRKRLQRDVSVVIYESKKQQAAMKIGRYVAAYLRRANNTATTYTEKVKMLERSSEGSSKSNIQEKEGSHVADVILTENEDESHSVHALNIDEILFAEVDEQPTQSNLEIKEQKEIADATEIFNMHKICMSEMLFKVKSGVALKKETLGRLAAEQQLEELRKQFESSLSSALSAQRDLEAKLAFEVKEKERIRVEIEIANLEDMIRLAESKLLKECEQYHAALVIQKFSRLVLRVRQRRLSIAAAVKAAAIQSNAAIVVQSRFRCYSARVQFLKMKASLHIIQQKIRRVVASRREQQLRMTADGIIRKWLRYVLQKVRHSKYLNAVAIIQRSYKSIVVRRVFIAKKQAVVDIQRKWKLYKLEAARKQYRSALCLQSAFIAMHYRHRWCQRRAALILQAFWTRCKARLTFLRERESNNIKHKCATLKAQIVLSRFFKRVLVRRAIKLAALQIEQWYLKLLPLIRARKLVKGFVRLQAFRRAVEIRRKQSTEVKSIYAKIKIANAHALSNPEMKLSSRTQMALYTLQKGKMVSHVLKACQTLEFSTSFSMICCSNFVAASASKVLFTLIRSCNRSTPHQELLRCALTVLINVTKDSTLAEKVVHNGDTTELLVDLMQMFRDKKIIFNLSCELLTRFVFAQNDIKNECLAPEMKKRLDGILHILERKHRLDQRVRKISSRTGNAAAGKSSPKSACIVSTVPPFELMQTFMTHLNIC